MSWLDRVAQGVDERQPQVINDSKTPSGRVHVGALRGVLIHDAIFRAFAAQGTAVRYLYGVDDYDPMDEVPAGLEEYYAPYLGMPLCNVPAPIGSNAPDIAEHYIGEFFEVFEKLGVRAEKYRMRDMYRQGKLNEAIDQILRNADAVRRIYKQVSNSDRPANWLPFQVICENCGRIGTTEVTAYDGREVTYDCRRDLVSWATGCGHHGAMSPFDGNGKLPWKLEWVAKWKGLSVTVEGAGKDHSTKGGARDVAERCLREIFQQKPPFNVPYEFFLVDGAKMSSSRGIGASAQAVSELLPPEILRFLMLRTQPKATVNFSLEQEFLIRVFNDYDRLHEKARKPEDLTSDEKQLYELSQVAPHESPQDLYLENFGVVLALVQMPHLDVVAEVAKRKGAALTPVELQHLQRRVKTALLWLESYASDEDRIAIQHSLPRSAWTLTPTQKAFLHRLGSELAVSGEWVEESLQNAIFDVARMVPLPASEAFGAIYRVLLGRDSGPKAGSLMAFLDRSFVIRRFWEMPYSEAAMWRHTALSEGQLESMLLREHGKIQSLTVQPAVVAAELHFPRDASGDRLLAGAAVLEFLLTMRDGKIQMKRMALGHFKGSDLSLEHECDVVAELAGEHVESLKQRTDVPMTMLPIRCRCESIDDLDVDRPLPISAIS